MNAWQKRNRPSHDDKGPEQRARSSNLTEGVANLGPSHNISPALSPHLDFRLKTLGGLLYVVGAIALLLFVHGGWFELPAGNTFAIDRVVLAGGILVWSVWFFPWHRFGRNVLLIPVSAAIVLITLAVYFSGGWQSPLSIFYLFVVVFCAGYFSTGVAALCVAVTLLASLTPQLYAPDTSSLVGYLAIQTPTYAGLVFACRYGLRERTRTQSEQASARIRDLEERLQHEASLDPLTGLYNRGHFETRFREEFERARRTGERFMVLFVDVDDFKLINDTHGHRAGDEALQLVADVLRACSGHVNVVARHGGDEFLVMLPGASLPEARRFFEEMREMVAERSGESLGLGLRLSAGAVQCPGDATDPATLLDAADEAMYRAKRRGKNRLFTGLSLAPTGHRRASSRGE
ncbi:MAG TPA: diguanylate cyclase [Rubrobacter sp.]|nr:diguanylate cyclase [Rubrobacter sp.]